jgi:hypothetical protein
VVEIIVGLGNSLAYFASKQGSIGRTQRSSNNVVEWCCFKLIIRVFPAVSECLLMKGVLWLFFELEMMI